MSAEQRNRRATAVTILFERETDKNVKSPNVSDAETPPIPKVADNKPTPSRKPEGPAKKPDKPKSAKMSMYRKESVISEVGRTADELPSIIAKLTTSTVVWTHPDNLYPFSRVLRLRVLQIVCGISILVMGAVGAIEERGIMTNLALGVPAGLLTVLAAGVSIHVSRGFGGYRVSRWSEGSVFRAIGPTPQTACPLFLLWTAAISLHTALFVQSALTLSSASLHRRDEDTKFQLAIVELVLSGATLGAVMEVLRVDLKHDPDRPPDGFTCVQQRSSSSERTQTLLTGTSSTEGTAAD